MTKRFEYEFEDEGSRSLTIDYDEHEDERLEVLRDNGQLFLFANKAGLLCLARICIKLALGQYQDGYHLHIRKDFDADLPEAFVLGLVSKREAKGD